MKAVLLSSLTLVISAKTCVKLVWADLQLLSLREPRVHCQAPLPVTSWMSVFLS